MASTSHLIRIMLKLEDQMSKELDKSQNSLKKLGDNLTSLGQKMTVGITAPIVAAGTAMFKTFSDFESVITEIGARTNATSNEIERMTELAIKMGRTTVFSANEAAQAMLELTSSGASAKDAMAMLPDVLNLAAAGALDLGRSADAVTDILAQFQLGVKDTRMVVDTLTQAAGASSATVETLIQAFENVGPVLAQFGISVNEGAAALAVLAENGIKGAEAGTQLKSMLLNMSRDTERVTEAWRTLGVSMFDAQGNMRDIDAIFKDINKAMEGMSMEEQIRLSTDLAGSYGLVGFNALRATNGISDMQAQMLSAGSAQEVAEARTKTLAGAFDRLMASLDTLGVIMGNLGSGPMVGFLNWLADVVSAFGQWAEANPAMAQTLMIILGIVAAVGPLLVIAGQLVGAFLALQTLAVGFGMTAAAFSAAFLPVLGLIVAIIGLIVLLIANWQTLSTSVMQLSQLVGMAWQKMFQIATTALGQLISLPGLFVAAIAKGWGILLERAKTTLSQLGTIIWQGITSSISKAGTALSQLGQIIWVSLQKIASSTFTLGQQIITGLIKGMASMIVDLIAMATGMSEDVKNAIKHAFGIASPSKVMMEMGKNVSLGFTKGLEAAGGVNVNPTVNGAPVSGRAPAMAGASAGSGGGNVYIGTINLPAGSTREQVDAFNKELARKAKIKGARKGS